MDFYKIRIKEGKNRVYEVYPEFSVHRSTDLMVRGGDFYAVWDEEIGLWSTDEYDVARLVDADLNRFILEAERKNPGMYEAKYLEDSDNGRWSKYRKTLKEIKDNNHQLDTTLTFSNTEVKKTDYISRRLPYALEPGSCVAWDELVGTLYEPSEREKIEWAIGSIVSGDSTKIQKFFVFYGPTGSGKSTIINIIESLFQGYTSTFDAKALGSSNGSFATEAFSENPMVAIQHDGDLSRLSDNTKLNSIVAHEVMRFNEKYKRTYDAKSNALVFMGTNQPVKITDSKSGLIRRLIDIHPSGRKIPNNHYNALMSRIEFELGAIAQYCLEVYLTLGKNHYNAYRPLEMMYQTDAFFNFIESYYDIFKADDGAALKPAFALYKEFCVDAGVEFKLPMMKFREELRSYFDEFHERIVIDGVSYRSYFSGFNANKFKAPRGDDVYSLVIDETISLFDNEFIDLPAQEAKDDESPRHRWSNVKTTLSEIDTSQLHYVKVPEQHIVIDFDLKGRSGIKSLEKNLEAASDWPPTYAELSKSGHGVHLHYNYSGDVSELANEYSPGIEVKVFQGNASLRRKLTKCNSVPIATLRTGLPLKEKKKVLESRVIKSEKGLRDLIERNLRKEIHPGTKPSIDFIYKILEESYESGMTFDVTDMQPKIVAFANNSTNQPLLSLKVVQRMRFKSENSSKEPKMDGPLVFFDCEVYPNLFVICWKKFQDDTVTRMINPTSSEVEALFRFKLVGFNNRRYDNHILYARFMGYDNETLFKLSQKIINNNVGATFGEAYNLSYADVWDFSSKKQGLKKWEVELGHPYMELDFPWEEPVDPSEWIRVEEYCVNDVLATEATFIAREQDFVARQILAGLSGLSVNDPTQKHTAKIIFGNERRPQDAFVYTDLREDFPGYHFDLGVSTYRGEITGEGGYVYAEPGIYHNVAVLDVASMHPTSIEQLNLFGRFTKNFSALKDARIAIKHKDFDAARKMLDGKLIPFLEGIDNSNLDRAETLSHALKIVINSVYGYTSAKYDTLFRDTRNKDNIVAKRGALFMIDLKYAVQEQGFIVAHIKTDSIKIPDASPEIIDFVIKFGQKYGYDFEHETTYDRFCLVNDAVYVAREDGQWHAVGAQFQHPYVFKKLFSHEIIGFDDQIETKHVTQGAMYLDFDAVQKPMFNYQGRHFIGSIGQFLPVTQESGGGILLRVKDDKSYAVTGTKGYFWVEAKLAKTLGCEGVEIDQSYYDRLVDEAIDTINKFGDPEGFLDVEWRR